MQAKQLNQLIQQLENYTECWKQFNYFVNLARNKRFNPEEESQFLEIKTVIIQELELILSAIDSGTPTKEEVTALISHAPSLRFLSELSEPALRNLESNWHKLYIGWHSALGQLKVQRQQLETRSMFASFFRRKK